MRERRYLCAPGLHSQRRRPRADSSSLRGQTPDRLSRRTGSRLRGLAQSEIRARCSSHRSPDGACRRHGGGAHALVAVPAHSLRRTFWGRGSGRGSLEFGPRLRRREATPGPLAAPIAPHGPPTHYGMLPWSSSRRRSLVGHASLPGECDGRSARNHERRSCRSGGRAVIQSDALTRGNPQCGFPRSLVAAVVLFALFSSATEVSPAAAKRLSLAPVSVPSGRIGRHQRASLASRRFPCRRCLHFEGPRAS